MTILALSSADQRAKLMLRTKIVFLLKRKRIVCNVSVSEIFPEPKAEIFGNLNLFKKTIRPVYPLRINQLRQNPIIISI